MLSTIKRLLEFVHSKERASSFKIEASKFTRKGAQGDD
jgi:hypothetical protein